MKIAIPELSLVMLVGPSGSGKSSFARKHFLTTEVSRQISAVGSSRMTTTINPRREMRSTSCTP
jgi:predicted kinase